LGHLTCKIVSQMTYNVSSGTLNPRIPQWCWSKKSRISMLLCSARKCRNAW